MKQVIQSRKTGKLALKDVPAPKVRSGCLLVRTRASLISAGTERMVVEFARKSLAGKAQARPDLVKKVLEKAKKEGLVNTWKTVMARLDEPLPLGYSAAGDVVAVGAGLEGEYAVGDRVAVAGAGVANHAELNTVPRNLVARIPANVPDEEACYTTLGAIAMHAVRNAGAGLGDVVAVIGCGLVGQMAIRFLVLGGARVIAFDYAEDRLALARAMGAEAALAPGGDSADTVHQLSDGLGADAVINAAATDSSEPLEFAAGIARDRARIVMVGLTGTTFPYTEFMQKELNLVVSRSYGPGRYDPDFEQRGQKYPEGWVRWTETANMAETLRLMQPERDGRLDATLLTTHRFALDDAEAAYALVTGGTERSLGVVLHYPEGGTTGVATLQERKPARTAGGCVLGVIGAGSFARAVLLPGLKSSKGVRFKTLVTTRGATAEHGADQFDFESAATDEAAVFDDAEINAVVVATRHDSHAALTAQALRAGKSVFTEKPLALDLEQLNDVIDALNASSGILHVGFNRRFAPQVTDMMAHFKSSEGPRVITIRVNGGAIDGSHWTQSADEGGGRVLGEMCHFVDLARHLAGAAITSVHAEAATQARGTGDNVAAHLRFDDGSLASIVYTALGDTALPKEHVEMFSGGRAAQLDDFRSLTLAAGGNVKTATATQDKGHKQQLAAFVKGVTDGTPPIAAEELIETAAATIAVMESLRSGERVDL
ncbi:MAG: bi-domain-containing oxidoreductase [Rhodospirillales bacterium]|nr:bi-domain-containing oxidoreductase [Rhodospirillales bacterium]MBO6788452.1 bi-domain-containing oxidoreductase [Rhodospirillales bacterium]